MRADQVARATAVLASRGYRPEPALTPAAEGALLGTWAERAFVRGPGFVVDLHWGIVPPLFAVPLAFDTLWRRAHSIAISGVHVAVPATEDLLVMSCIHGGKHLWERIAWIADVAWLVRASPDLDWTAVINEARDLRAQRLVRLALALAHGLLGATLPSHVLEWVRTGVPPLYVDVCARRIGPAATPPGLLEDAWFHVRCRERLGDRLRYAVRWITTPSTTDWAIMPLPGRLFWVYRLLRPFRVARKYLPRLARSKICWRSRPTGQ